MKPENYGTQTNAGNKARELQDRHGWISKYLELADRIIQTHMPQLPKAARSAGLKLRSSQNFRRPSCSLHSLAGRVSEELVGEALNLSAVHTLVAIPPRLFHREPVDVDI